MLKKVLVLVLVLVTFASFAETKICVIDMQKVYMEYNQTKKVANALEAKTKEIDAEIKKKYAEPLKAIEIKLKKLQEVASSIALKQETRNKAAFEASNAKDEYAVKQKEAMNYKKMKEREIQIKMKKLRDKLVVDILNVIKVYSKEKGIDILLDKTGKTASGIPTVIYSNDSIDVTSDIIAKLNG